MCVMGIVLSCCCMPSSASWAARFLIKWPLASTFAPSGKTRSESRSGYPRRSQMTSHVRPPPALLALKEAVVRTGDHVGDDKGHSDVCHSFRITLGSRFLFELGSEFNIDSSRPVVPVPPGVCLFPPSSPPWSLFSFLAPKGEGASS